MDDCILSWVNLHLVSNLLRGKMQQRCAHLLIHLADLLAIRTCEKQRACVDLHHNINQFLAYIIVNLSDWQRQCRLELNPPSFIVTIVERGNKSQIVM